MAKLTLAKASTDVTVYLFVQNNSVTTGAGLTGLAYNTASLTCYYVRPGAAAAALSLATQTTTGAHSDGGFVEVDATNMPGVYRLDLSDAVCATGVNSVVVMLKGATNMAPCLLEIQLSDFNLNSSAPSVNVAQISGDSTAADNAESFFDGTGYAGTGNTIPTVTTVTNQVTAAAIRSEMDSNSTQLAAIVADTNELQTDWANGGRLDLILDARASQTSVDTIDGIVDSILVDTGTDIPAAISGLNDLSQADVRTAIGLASANLDTQLSTIDGVADAILADTGTTGVIVATNNDKSGYSISGTLTTLDALDTAQDTQHSTTQSAIAALNDVSSSDVQTATAAALIAYDPPTKAELDTAIDALPTAAENRAEMDSNSTQLAAIVADTNELQTDWTDGGRLDLILDARASQTSVDTIDGIVDNILIDTGTDIPASIAALNNLSVDQVNAQVLDVLNVDVFSELTGVPADDTTLSNMIRWLYIQARNKVTQTATTQTIYADDGSTSVATSTVSDDGTTATRGEFA